MDIKDLSPRQFLNLILPETGSVSIDDAQEQQLGELIKALPSDAGLADLVEAVAGNSDLAPLHSALQERMKAGAYGSVFLDEYHKPTPQSDAFLQAIRQARIVTYEEPPEFNFSAKS